MQIAIIYHDADFDGKLSRAVCMHHLSLQNNSICEFGWDYGRPIPVPLIKTFNESLGDQFSNKWEDFDEIYIVDLSVDELMARPELRDKIVWIDHHKSAIDKWKDVPFAGYRIDGVAACRLCWQWFWRSHGPEEDYRPQKDDFVNRKVEEPTLIRLAGMYDVWDHRDPDAKALQFGLRAIDGPKMDALIHYQFACGPKDDVDRLYLNPIIESGHLIKSYCDRNNDDYAATCAHTLQWEGLTFCALNIGQRGNSDLLRGGLKPEHQACFAWRFIGPTGKAMVSLYHAPGHEDIDLSLIATKYGGGGHRGACGFQVTLDELAKILN